MSGIDLKHETSFPKTQAIPVQDRLFNEENCIPPQPSLVKYVIAPHTVII